MDLLVPSLILLASLWPYRYLYPKLKTSVSTLASSTIVCFAWKILDLKGNGKEKDELLKVGR